MKQPSSRDDWQLELPPTPDALSDALRKLNGGNVGSNRADGANHSNTAKTDAKPVAINVADVAAKTSVTASGAKIAGLQQDVIYRIVAGDAASNEFQITVQAVPALAIDHLEYHYPSYTGRTPETRSGETDIQALEGTRVTIYATANQPISESTLELYTGERWERRVNSFSEQQAVGIVALSFADRNALSPEFTHYQMRFRNTDGKLNPEPLRYPIKVERDEAPVVELLEPRLPEIEVNLTQPITFVVKAFDPDFGLSQVRLVFNQNEQAVFQRELTPNLPDQKITGNFYKEIQLSPLAMGFKVGDVIEYRAEATDVKRPDANTTSSATQRFRVIGNPRDQSRRTTKTHAIQRINNRAATILTTATIIRATRRRRDLNNAANNDQNPDRPNPNQVANQARPGDQARQNQAEQNDPSKMDRNNNCAQQRREPARQ